MCTMCKKASGNDQEIAQSHTADNPRHRKEETYNTNNHKTPERQIK